MMVLVESKEQQPSQRDPAKESNSNMTGGDGMDIEKSSIELRKNFERSFQDPRNVTPPPQENHSSDESSPTAQDMDDTDDMDHSSSNNGKNVARGGVVVPFPWKLHEMLERVEIDEFASIVSWQPHGRSFMVHKPEEFVNRVMPIYFNQTKFASFQRQLNLYGFRRFTCGRDKGAYYHDCFLRGRKSLCSNMVRKKIKGTKVRRAMVAGSEPNFYGMPFMPSASQSIRPKLPSLNKSETLKINTKTTRAPATSTITSSRPTSVMPKTVSSKSSNTTPAVIHIQHSPPPTPFHPYQTYAPSTPPLAPERTSTTIGTAINSWLSPPQPVTPEFPTNKSIVVVKTTLQDQAPNGSTKCGDVLFFEGKPFHYLDHGYGVQNILSHHHNIHESNPTLLLPPRLFMLPGPAV